MTPRQLTGTLKIVDVVHRLQLHDDLTIGTLAARGELKDVKKTLKQLERGSDGE